MRIILTVILICIAAAGVARSQTGPPYEITQSVIAGGGATSTDGGQYSITGTIAQPAAGVLSSSGPYRFRAGFWQSFVRPTAAGVSISGRVLTADRYPVSRSRVVLTSPTGGTISALSSPFGYYRFDDVTAGSTYLLEVRDRRLQFVPFAVTVLDEITDLDLIALP